MIRILLLLLFISCSKEIDDLGFRVYTIPEGEHSSGNFINHPVNSKIEFKRDLIDFYFPELLLTEGALFLLEAHRHILLALRLIQ